MAAARTTRPFANTLLQSRNAAHRTAPSIACCQLQHQHQQRRTFFPNPFASEKQTLTASRTLPYKASTIYATISDVASYSKFLPYCQSSTVTKSSNPAPANNTSYPEEAKLSIGFNSDVSEEFWSRVYCVPDRVVEAVSGLTDTSLSPQEIEHHNPRPAPQSDPTRNQSVLTHLATKWVLRSYPYKPGEETGEPAKHMTDVNLVIEYQFANPVYAALSAAAAPKVAEKMIEAFENRVKAVAEGRA
jgi:coenzyme Q-binding protein COQ10